MVNAYISWKDRWGVWPFIAFRPNTMNGRNFLTTRWERYNAAFASLPEFCIQLHNYTILDSTRKSTTFSKDVSVPLFIPHLLFFTVAVRNPTAAVLHSAMPHLSLSEKSLQHTWTGRGMHSAGTQTPHHDDVLHSPHISPRSSSRNSPVAACLRAHSLPHSFIRTPCCLTSMVANMETLTKAGFTLLWHTCLNRVHHHFIKDVSHESNFSF